MKRIKEDGEKPHRTLAFYSDGAFSSHERHPPGVGNPAHVEAVQVDAGGNRNTGIVAAVPDDRVFPRRERTVHERPDLTSKDVMDDKAYGSALRERERDGRRRIERVRRVLMEGEDLGYLRGVVFIHRGGSQKYRYPSR